MTQWQLRDYTIEPGRLDVFLDEWRRGVRPLRERFGFDVVGWAVPEESRFVWVIGYDGPLDFEDADRAYYASPERVALDPDPGRWVTQRRHLRVEAALGHRP